MTKRRLSRQQRMVMIGDAHLMLREAQERLNTEERGAYEALLIEAGDKPLSTTDKLAILERARTQVRLGPLLETETTKPPEKHRQDLFGG